jgi:anti-sigma factor RsiW
MSDRKFSDELLHAYADGEAGEATAEIEQELLNCAQSQAEVDSVRITGEYLRDIVSQGVPEVEPLRALQSIRERIEQEEAKSAKSRWTSFWEGIFASPRQMALGFACAAALGAVVAPAALWLMGTDGIDNYTATDGQPQTASVVVESVEIEGNAKTVVFQPQGSDTAVIWIDAGEEVYEEEF